MKKIILYCLLIGLSTTPYLNSQSYRLIERHSNNIPTNYVHIPRSYFSTGENYIYHYDLDCRGAGGIEIRLRCDFAYAISCVMVYNSIEEARTFSPPLHYFNGYDDNWVKVVNEKGRAAVSVIMNSSYLGNNEDNVFEMWFFPSDDEALVEVLHYVYDWAGNRTKRILTVVYQEPDTPLMRSTPSSEGDANKALVDWWEEKQITLSPNPSDGQINLSITTETHQKTAYSYALYSAAGLKLQTGKINHPENHPINIAAYAAGVYFLHLYGNNETKTYRIIRK